MFKTSFKMRMQLFIGNYKFKRATALRTASQVKPLSLSPSNVPLVDCLCLYPFAPPQHCSTCLTGYSHCCRQSRISQNRKSNHGGSVLPRCLWITLATPSMPQHVDCPTDVAVAPKFGLTRTWPGLVEKC